MTEISEALGAGTYYIRVDVADASSAVSDIISAFSLQVEVSATTTIIDPIIDPTRPADTVQLLFLSAQGFHYEELDPALRNGIRITWSHEYQWWKRFLAPWFISLRTALHGILTRLRASRPEMTKHAAGQFDETDSWASDSGDRPDC